MPVIVLAGEEELLISRRLAELKSTLLVSPWQTVNFIKLSNPSFITLQEAAASLPFGAGKRIVLIENCQFFTKKRGKTSSTKDSSEAENDSKSNKASKSKQSASEKSPEAELEEALASVAANTYLIFSCPYNFDSTLKLSKSVSKHSQIEEFPKEKYFPGSRNPKLETWCRQEAKKHNATIDDAAIQFLLNSTEADLRQLSSEIEKAAVHVLPETKITENIVVGVCSPQGHIFQFIDLWLNGQTGKALHNLQTLLAQQSAMPVLATMQTMLSKWIKVKTLYETYAGAGGGQPSQSQIAKQIAADLKLMPFSVEKDLHRLEKYNASQLVDKRLQLTRLEYSIKIGQIPDQHALSLFVLS